MTSAATAAIAPRTPHGSPPGPSAMTVDRPPWAPGAGKGTQARRPDRAARGPARRRPATCSGPRFATARRSVSRRDRYMERGQLVPDDITIRMLLDRLEAADAADRRDPRRVPAERGPGRGARRRARRARRPGRSRRLHRRPARGARAPAVGPLDLRRGRPRLQRALEPAARRRAAATSTAPSSIQRADDQPRRDPGAAGRPARRPRPRSSTTTGGPASSGRSTALGPIDDVTDGLLAALTDDAVGAA